jgi:hypothetical protein
MSWRQHMMVVFLAAILLAVVIATAAKTQSPAMAAAQVEVWIEPPAPKTWLISNSNMTTRAKTSLRRTTQVSPCEITSTWDQGAVWDQGPVYNLTRTRQASIDVLVYPDTCE